MQFLEEEYDTLHQNLYVCVYYLTQQFQVLEFVPKKLFVNYYLRGSRIEQLGGGETLILNWQVQVPTITSNETTHR